MVAQVTKAERLAIFFDRLDAALPARDANEAYDLIATTLNAVEDEFSGAPYNPPTWKTDGRMYPPFDDNRRAAIGYPEVTRYRSVGHHTMIGSNGSIQIVSVRGETLLAKAGADGRHVWQI